jgi:hypothetical protein
MALWGNNDNKFSGGTVSLDYDTLLVTGAGTTFGNVGAAATGDVIRFGDLAGVFYGDAVIVGIASTTQLSIASTAGLSGSAISGAQFLISELPKFTVLDSHYSQLNGNSTESTLVLNTTAAAPGAGIGTNTVPLTSVVGIITGDTFVSGVNSKVITSIGATTVSFGSTISAGIATGASVSITRTSGGYERYVVGVDTAGVGAAASTRYELTHSGWVGITTYVDSEGNLRVKNEVLVAMSGIQTGNTPLYPPS